MKETKDFLLKFLVVVLSMITVTTIYWHICISKIWYETQLGYEKELQDITEIKNDLWRIVDLLLERGGY